MPDVTTRQLLLATVLVFGLPLLLTILFLYVTRSVDAPIVVLVAVQIVTAVIVPCLVIARVFKTRFIRAVQVWLPTLLAPVPCVVIVLFVLRPFLYGAFVLPTNSMAQTLIGTHWRGSCPECGSPNYCTPVDSFYGSPDPPRMICGNFHVTQLPNVAKLAHSGDRILVAKFLTPQRWDLVVFQYPENPSLVYVDRLVGMPGEEILVRDGSVWANGKKLTPPDSLTGINYLSEIPDWYGPETWGSAERPALLGDDEYFVLGDFSAQSNDCRMWKKGAAGHNPFAVPESHLIGVVTHIYWPLDRWRIFR